MKKYYALLLLLLVSLSSFAQSYDGPESVEFDYTSNRWLIGNKNSHEVLARDASGNLTVLIPGSIVGSTGPYGIEIVDNVLYMCCGGTIKGFDLSTLELVFTVNTGGTFLNGITHDNAGNLFVTDFSAKKIYKINIASESSSTVASNLVQQPNGIIFDEPNNRCVFVNWGSNAPIKAMDLNDYSVTTLLTTGYSNIDGIAKDGSGNYYISVWQGQQVVKLDNDFLANTVIVNQNLSGPADLFFNTQDLVLGIPNSGNHTVTLYEFHLGLDEIQNQTLHAFPNPAENQMKIEWNENTPMPEEIHLYDLSGKQIATLTQPHVTAQNNSIVIQIETLHPGIYFVHVPTNDGLKVVRLVKK